MEDENISRLLKKVLSQGLQKRHLLSKVVMLKQEKAISYERLSSFV